MKISRIVFVLCLISSMSQVYAAYVYARYAKNTPLSAKCYFCCRNLERAICANCCGSSTFSVNKKGIPQQVIQHYSCCYADNAGVLAHGEYEKIFSENEKLDTNHKVIYKYGPVICCCINQARITINSTDLLVPSPVKPAAVDAKRD